MNGMIVLLTDGPDVTMVLLMIVGCWLTMEEKSMFAILTTPGICVRVKVWSEMVRGI